MIEGERMNRQKTNTHHYHSYKHMGDEQQVQREEEDFILMIPLKMYVQEFICAALF
jgi:hypothetical protein